MTVTREEALEIFARRRATRAYDPDRRVNDEDFAAILEFARLSPSSVGTEPWKFLVIQDPELREKLKPIAWGMAGQLDAASHLVVLLAKKGLRYDTPGCAAPSRAATSPRSRWKPHSSATATSRRTT